MREREREREEREERERERELIGRSVLDFKQLIMICSFTGISLRFNIIQESLVCVFNEHLILLLLTRCY